MAADILVFKVFAGSGKGLMARPVLPNDVVAKKSLIASITYSIHKLSGGLPVTGELVVDLVMSETPVKWKADPDGRTFLWPAPGTLWPDPNESYRVVVTYTTTANAVPEAGEAVSFIEVWQADTINPISN